MNAGAFLLLQHLLPRRLLTRVCGRLAECETPWLKNILIRCFVGYFKVDMNEAAEPDPRAYRNFNAFFTRELAAGARPLDPAPDSVLCPADGVVSEIGRVEHGRLLQAKGRHYSAAELLGDAGRAEAFAKGRFATVYLSPRDYHRVHMPLGGTLTAQQYVPGSLFSVNQVTAENMDRLFVRNERLVCHFETEVGPTAVVMVGALIVAGIETVWADPASGGVDTTNPVRLERGGEMGHFRLGSTVILLFPDGTVEWENHLAAGSPVRMGQRLGRTIPG